MPACRGANVHLTACRSRETAPSEKPVFKAQQELNNHPAPNRKFLLSGFFVILILLSSQPRSMSTKTKKAPAAGPKEIKSTKPPALTGALSLPLLFLVLYLLVDFIPPLGAADVMGSQWLYLALLDLLCAGYLFWSKNTVYTEAANAVSRTVLTVLYLSLFVVSGVSILVALNKIEAFVCYARFAVTLVMFFNLAVLLYGRPNPVHFLSQALVLVLFLQSASVLAQFFKGYGETDLNQLILGLKGNAGNKNILAASLVIKLPFVFYGIYQFRSWRKLFCVLTVTLACFAVAILNARAAYISLALVTLLYLIFIVREKVLSRPALLWQKFVPVPAAVILAFFVSALVLKNAAGLQDKETYFGNLGERLTMMGTSRGNASHRGPLWKSAVDYIKHHPFTGAGYGNWKLVSIPYERSFSKDFEITYHVHNDFLEAATELGLPGALLLIGLFVCAGFYGLKTLRSKNHDLAVVAAFSLMALGAYFVDAFFNFPAERPVMQFFLTLILALLATGYLQARQKNSVGKPLSKKWFLVGSLVLLLPALWLCYTTYRSMKLQYVINAETQLPRPQKGFEEVNQLPSIPNLNVYGLPVDGIKAHYLYAEKKYDQALELLSKSRTANPYLPYDDLIRARIFSETNRLDSALFYALQGMEKRPKSAALFQTLDSISFQLKDTALLNQSFKNFIRHRNEAWAWNEYLNYLYDLPHDPEKMRMLVDSALKLFPDDPYLQHKKNFLKAGK